MEELKKELFKAIDYLMYKKNLRHISYYMPSHFESVMLSGSTEKDNKYLSIIHDDGEWKENDENNQFKGIAKELNNLK